jgi:Mce-associated membrane protein
VPSFRRRASVIDADRVDEPPQESERAADAADALSLAEEAEAEAAEAEAVATAARARARAIRLRRQAKSDEIETKADEAEATATEVDATATEAEGVVAEPVDAAEPEETSEVDDADEPSEEKPARWRRIPLGRILKTLAAGLAVVCTGALITLSVLMVVDHRNQVAEQQRTAEYSAAARQSVVTLMSLDFNKAKEDVQRIIDNSTGQFRDDFNHQAEDFVKVAQESKVITKVSVNATAVEKMTQDTATVLVSATSNVTNSSGANQEPRSWRLSVDLQRDGGQIKMAKVEFVP